MQQISDNWETEE